MKKKIDIDDDEMPAEFDFSNAVPNPWFVAVHGAKFVRVIDQDLADLFPDNASMNAALRNVAEVAARIPAPTRKISAQRVSAPKAAKKK
jgi:hypothetical protein